MGADEVEHRTERFVLGFPETSAELLEEQRRALGWSQHEHGVDVRDVDTLVEQVDREHGLYSSVGEVAQRRLAFGPRAVAPDGDGLDAVKSEVVGHESRVLDAHAEPETAHRCRLGVLHHLLDDQPSPGVGARVGVAERVHVVAPTATPRDVTEVEAVVDAEVEEGHEVLLADGVPQAQLCCDAVVEPVQDR